MFDRLKLGLDGSCEERSAGQQNLVFTILPKGQHMHYRSKYSFDMRPNRPVAGRALDHPVSFTLTVNYLLKPYVRRSEVGVKIQDVHYSYAIAMFAQYLSSIRISTRCKDVFRRLRQLCQLLHELQTNSSICTGNEQ